MGKKYFSAIIKGIFRFFNRLRLFLVNIIFWGLLAGLAFLLFQGEIVPDVNRNTVLKVALNGQIVEQHTGGYQSELENLAYGRGEILLRELKKVIDSAASDDRITSMFLDLSGFEGSGLAKLQETASSLDKFKESGKKIICYSDKFGTGSYYLASRADKIILDPLGEIRLRGFSSYRNYFKKGLDKYSIKMNVFKAGDYKSAVEPFLLEKMSDNHREALERYFNTVFDAVLMEIAEKRGKNRDNILDYIKNYYKYFEKNRGDSAETALDAGFTDSIGDYSSAFDNIDEVEEIEWTDYLKVVGREKTDTENKIAVITATGMIIDGDFGPGKIGSETFRKLIDSAADNPDVKAVVFRIDSGGGSSSASEIIRRAVIKLKEMKKPVVVSMSSSSASGGYWISADSDRIFAYPSTVTGSIGAFSVLPDYSDFLEKYPGITVDGFSVPDSPPIYRPYMKLDEKEKGIIQLSIENLYSRFINIVAEGRDLSPESVKKIAGGRIWSGIDAVENGLVDETGFFDDAVNAAAELAGLSEYSLFYIDPEEDWKTQVVREFAVLIKKMNISALNPLSGSLSDLAEYFSLNEGVAFFEPGILYSWTWMGMDFCL